MFCMHVGTLQLWTKGMPWWFEVAQIKKSMVHGQAFYEELVKVFGC
jgi:hypothetical protein